MGQVQHSSVLCDTMSGTASGEVGLLAWSLDFNGGQPPDLRIRSMIMIMGYLSLQRHLFNLYPTNAPDPFKSVSYERTKWVRCGHLNAPHSHVQA